ncbi:MAG: ATP-binding cassette domain-containing protein [Lachnospiraceae bacterium]
MSQIAIQNLTFSYDGQEEPIFENVTLSLDTNWRLGLVGRNGRGKTTFLRILNGELPYQGNIKGCVPFDRFPYALGEKDMDRTAQELIPVWKPGIEDWQVLCRMPELSLASETLYLPLRQLSFGERIKLMLAVLFSGENEFLLIDEPTNHLDEAAREEVKHFLAGQKGFLLVSHDRDLLDACTDHILAMVRTGITVENGNFSTWWGNRMRQDAFARAENEKHKKEIGRLKKSAARVADWAGQSENTKIGYDPIRDNNHPMRDYIGGKTKKLESRAGSVRKRITAETERKKGLLADVEETPDLSLTILPSPKERLLLCRDLSLAYPGAAQPVFSHLTFSLERGEQVRLSGANGCGKSTFYRYLMERCGMGTGRSLEVRSGELILSPELVISCLPQDVTGLSGSLSDFARTRGLDRSVFFAILRELDVPRSILDGRLEDFSEGQKKKALLAASLLTPANLFLWDEPMNSLDVFTRMQVEDLLRRAKPTLLFSEHDVRFRQDMAAREVVIGG